MTTETTTETSTSSSQVVTGDTAPIERVCIIMLLSVVGLLGLGVIWRCSKKDEE